LAAGENGLESRTKEELERKHIKTYVWGSALLVKFAVLRYRFGQLQGVRVGETKFFLLQCEASIVGVGVDASG
jgi:hypothetical protein